MCIVSARNYLFPRSLKTNGPFSQISKTPGRLGPQGEEAVINAAYSKINCTMQGFSLASALGHSPEQILDVQEQAGQVGHFVREHFRQCTVFNPLDYR